MSELNNWTNCCLGICVQSYLGEVGEDCNFTNYRTTGEYEHWKSIYSPGFNVCLELLHCYCISRFNF